MSTQVAAAAAAGAGAATGGGDAGAGARGGRRGNRPRGGGNTGNSNSNNRGSNKGQNHRGRGGNNNRGGRKGNAAQSEGPDADVDEQQQQSDEQPEKIVEQMKAVALSEAGDSDEPQSAVVFTESADAPFSNFNLEALPHKDSKLFIYFETQEMMEDTLLILRFNCPDPECDYIGNGWGDLKLHVRATHGKMLCDLCIRHKKVFSHEHALYSAAALSVHLPSMAYRGKPPPKDQIEGGVHPLCKFCRDCFFGDDEMYAHMRERHEECFICKRNDVRHQYFQNYEALEKHFNTDHYPCSQSECLARKFVVFNTPLDLKAHIVEEHGGDMSARDKRNVSRLQAEFTFEEVGYGNRHGRRDRERDRDPPPQRQQVQIAEPSRAAQNAGARRREAFSGALTTEGSGAAGSSSNQPSRGASRPSTPPVATDVDPAVAAKHADFLTRLQTLAPNPTTAVPAVKAATRSYRFSECTARDLISTIWNVMDRHLEHTASIVNAFVDLLDEEDKKQDLLSSWKGFAIEQRRQFPELTPNAVGSEYSGIASGRVLNAKHATAARSSGSQQVWNRVALVASSSSRAPQPALAQTRTQAKPTPQFPSLSSTVSQASSSTAPYRQGQPKTAWSSSAAAQPGFRPAIQPTSVQNNRPPKQPAPQLSKALFPDLPSSSSSRSKPQVSGNVSLRNILGTSNAPSASAWGASGDSGGQASEEVAESESTQAGGAGKKKKGKQKQTLFTLGSFPN
ncbi:hypothetical protein CVT24_011423 [Panaeolus cyanescens]|uniref:C2H2-type domain-containing protein n=1 Tax=Panaeolus cyanescens TaxID=181874 RepID=A0A409YGQ3_9AGAR|nr:hypothetical protein CVT24_011423 [Panaeolus cyanescens]